VVQSNSPQLTDGVHEGDVLAGKYRVDRVLGAGAMGIVVAAHHLHLDRKVAIKFLLPTMLHDQDAVARFAREARAAAKIRSEHVAQVLDVGTLDSGAPYMVMEFLDGSDLAEWLRRRGPLPFGEAVEFVLQACEALAEAHMSGIVHRDLKPANLFCTRRPDGLLSVKVLDFGISKVGSMPGAMPEMSMTRTSAVMGTPYYMSPEQLRASRDVDPRTDIWAMGVILYELATGMVPFNGESLSDVCIKIATESPPALRALRPDTPPGFEAVVERCLRKDRGQRYSTVAEFARALAPFATERARGSIDRVSRTLREPAPEPSASLTGTLAAPAEDPNTGTFGPLGRTTTGSKGRSTAAIAALGVVAVVALVGAAVVMGGRGRPASAETPVASPGPALLPAKETPAPPPPPVASPAITAEPTAASVVSAPAPVPADPLPRKPVSGGNQGEPRPRKPSAHAPQATPQVAGEVPSPPKSTPPSPADDSDPFSKLTPK